jgi:hypothetical protein
LVGCVNDAIEGARLLQDSAWEVRSENLKLPNWTRFLSATVMEIGNLVLLGVGAEVLSDHLAFVEKQVPGKLLISAGCCNNMVGYWPTTKVYHEGGYEGRTSQVFFPLVDWAEIEPDHAWNQLVSRLLGSGQVVRDNVNNLA